MDEFLTQLFKTWTTIYELCGWWALAIVGATYLLMIPTNIGVKKLFKLGKASEPKDRARKVISSLLVFVVASGVLTSFVAFADRSNLNFNFIVQGSIATGIMAKLLHWLEKLIMDLGLAPVLLAIANSKRLETHINGLGVDNLTYKIILDYTKRNFTKDFNYDELEDKTQAQAQYTKDLETRLRGFVKDPSGMAKDIIDYILLGCNKEEA